LKLGENENLSALDLTIILRAYAPTRTANRYEIAIHGTTATLTRYYSGTSTQLGQWTVDINDRLLKAGAVWDDVNESGYGGVTVTLKSGNETLFSYRDESNLNVSTPGYFGLATESSIKLGRVTEYVDMRSVIADKNNWKSGSSISWEDNDTRLTPVGSSTAGYTGRTFGDAEFVVGFESGLNTGAFPCFILRAPTEEDLLNNPWSGAKYSVIIKEGSLEIQHWQEIWKPGASILSNDGRSALADNKGFVQPYKDTLVKVSTVNTDYGVWIRLKAGDTIVASWIDENNYIQSDGYFGVSGYTEPISISVPNESTYVPVIGDPDAKPGSTNALPVVGNYNVSTNANTSVTGTVIAADADEDTLTYSVGTQAGHGTAVVNADGSWTYTPAVDYTGTDSFTVSVSDGKGGMATSTVSLTTLNLFTITASAGEHGSISPIGETDVEEGTGITYTFIPDSGYKVDKVMIDGQELKKVKENSYIFADVTGNHTISVTFKRGGGKPTQ
jgi:VCBS repeat-containing protein